MAGLKCNVLKRLFTATESLHYPKMPGQQRYYNQQDKWDRTERQPYGAADDNWPPQPQPQWQQWQNQNQIKQNKGWYG